MKVKEWTCFTISKDNNELLHQNGAEIHKLITRRKRNVSKRNIDMAQYLSKGTVNQINKSKFLYQSRHHILHPPLKAQNSFRSFTLGGWGPKRKPSLKGFTLKNKCQFNRRVMLTYLPHIQPRWQQSRMFKHIKMEKYSQYTNHFSPVLFFN